MVDKHKKGSVLVCVTGQKDCDRLIMAGRELAKESDLFLEVLCVQPTSQGFSVKSDVIEYLHKSAATAGAQMNVFFYDDAPLIAAGFAKQINVKRIVTGLPGDGMNGFVQTVHCLLPEIAISMVSGNQTYHMYPSFEYVNECVFPRFHNPS